MFLSEGAIYEQKLLLQDPRADETIKSLAYANLALKAVVLTDGFTRSKYTAGAFRFNSRGRLIGLKADAVGQRFADCAAAIQRNVAENRSRRASARNLLGVRRSGLGLNSKTIRNSLLALERRKQGRERRGLSRVQSNINLLKGPRTTRKQVRLGTIAEKRGELNTSNTSRRTRTRSRARDNR
jgi:hypothetical protein